MPLTVAQTTAFFEQPTQMGIANSTMAQVRLEGITVVDDLADFNKDIIDQMAANLRRPAGRIPDPNPAAAPGAMISTVLYVFGAKSCNRLCHAAELVCFYNTVGRPLTALNMRWDGPIKN